jgi:hypothetical protein
MDSPSLGALTGDDPAAGAVLLDEDLSSSGGLEAVPSGAVGGRVVRITAH